MISRTLVWIGFQASKGFSTAKENTDNATHILGEELNN
jgi:hypothetical protein